MITNEVTDERELPLAEILKLASAANIDINDLNDQLCRVIRELEGMLREDSSRFCQRVISTLIEPGIELAWSGARRKAGVYYWRFVIRDEDGVIELLTADPEDRSEAFTSGAMTRLFEELKKCRRARI